ncbi:acyltransferase [Streptacidiphilus sp. 4-A2]|nr:acyltransferase [Streptacidiphilus sp. 4-A2]
MRAVAAVIVVFFHFGGPACRALSGWIGVHIFFVLSGFLITTLMLREKDRTGRISLRNFYVRRVFRIMPLYYLALAATVANSYRQGRAWPILRGHLPEYLGFMNEYHLNPATPFLHTWTIGIEQKFYLVWPLGLVLAGLLSSRLRIPFAVVATVAVLIPWTSYLAACGIHYSVLLLGALLALVLHHPRGFALLSPLTHPLAGAGLLVGFLCLHMSIPGLVGRLGGEPPVIFLYGLAVALLLPSLLGPGIGRWLFSLRPLVFVGERSYGLYLFQFLAGAMLFALVPGVRGEPGVLAATLVALAALAVADLTHRRVEQPMIGLGRRLTRRPDAGRDREAPDPHRKQTPPWVSP